MAQAFFTAAALLKPDFRLGRLETEAQDALSARYGICSIPTLVLLDKRREIARRSSTMPKAPVVAWAHSAVDCITAPEGAQFAE